MKTNKNTNSFIRHLNNIRDANKTVIIQKTRKFHMKHVKHFNNIKF